MKKNLFLILMLLLPMVAGAETVEIDGIYYNLVSDTKEARVTSNPNKYTGSVVIPSSVTYDGMEYSVTSIGAAFSGCSGLTSVTIPNSVTSIRISAFRGCSGLTSVTFHCKAIESWFSGLSSIKEIIIGEEVTSIESEAFSGTGWYNNQPDGILYLDSWLIGYKGEKPTGTLEIADGTKRLANSAFYSCSGLTTLN